MMNPPPEPPLIRPISDWLAYVLPSAIALPVFGANVMLAMGGAAGRLSFGYVIVPAVLVTVMLIGAVLYSWRIIRQERAIVQSLFEDAAWMRWRTSPAEWQLELVQRRALAERTRRLYLWFRRIGIAVAIFLGGQGPLVAYLRRTELDSNQQMLMIGLSLLIVLLITISILLLTGQATRRAQQGLERAEQVHAPWIVFGLYGFYHEADGLITLRELGWVDYASSEQKLFFYSRSEVKEKTVGKPGAYQPVVVPEAHAEDAPALVRRYREERKLKG